MSTRNPKKSTHPTEYLFKSSTTVPSKNTPQVEEAPKREEFRVPEGEEKIESCQKRLRQFASLEAGTGIDIVPISLEEAETLQQTLAREGIKYRFDWDSKTSTATFRMPTPLHSTTLATWIGDVQLAIRDTVLTAAPCRKQRRFISGGDTRVLLEDNSTLQPDASFGIKEGERGGESKGMWRRVVFESLLSQSLDEGRKKLQKYLFKTKEKFEVHAGVLINYENPPTPKSDKKCVVSLEVWVRDEVGDEAIDLPRDKCSKKDPATPEPAQEDEPPSSSSSGDSEDGTQETGWASNEGTMVAEEDLMRIGSLPEVMVVYDEAKQGNQGGLENLVLDAYDFFHICRRKRRRIPSNKRLIEIDLSGLRDIVYDVVDDERQMLAAKHQQLKSDPLRRKQPEESESDEDLPLEHKSYSKLMKKKRRHV
ncbi:hypothetical protein FRC11_010368 [Ceratobasidium sp. 423]|nr:hypothetical protein FRC11_010368 [Ceratobasidium sp. 423]